MKARKANEITGANAGGPHRISFRALSAARIAQFFRFAIAQAMGIEKPAWTLRRFCPVCNQGSSLALLTCPLCKHVIASCDEDMAAFPDPRRLDVQDAQCNPWEGDTTRCPHCGRSVRFSTSTADEIQGSGLTKDDYQ
jgi:hypothetical protein